MIDALDIIFESPAQEAKVSRRSDDRQDNTESFGQLVQSSANDEVKREVNYRSRDEDGREPAQIENTTKPAKDRTKEDTAVDTAGEKYDPTPIKESKTEQTETPDTVVSTGQAEDVKSDQGAKAEDTRNPDIESAAGSEKNTIQTAEKKMVSAEKGVMTFVSNEETQAGLEATVRTVNPDTTEPTQIQNPVFSQEADTEFNRTGNQPAENVISAIQQAAQPENVEQADQQESTDGDNLPALQKEAEKPKTEENKTLASLKTDQNESQPAEKHVSTPIESTVTKAQIQRHASSQEEQPKTEKLTGASANLQAQLSKKSAQIQNPEQQVAEPQDKSEAGEENAKTTPDTTLQKTAVNADVDVKIPTAVSETSLKEAQPVDAPLTVVASESPAKAGQTSADQGQAPQTAGNERPIEQSAQSPLATSSASSEKPGDPSQFQNSNGGQNSGQQKTADNKPAVQGQKPSESQQSTDQVRPAEHAAPKPLPAAESLAPRAAPTVYINLANTDPATGLIRPEAASLAGNYELHQPKLTAQQAQNLQTQLAFHIARQFAGGITKFDIRLDPPELGRIAVQLEVAKDGRIKATLSADKQDTLDLLQRDQRFLQKSLNDAGLDLDLGDFSFNLNDNGAGTNTNKDGNESFDWTTNAKIELPAPVIQASAEELAAWTDTYGFKTIATTGINITA